MHILNKFSNEELEQELERRKIKSKIPSPIKIENLDKIQFNELVTACENHLDDLADDDGERYIYEEAMQLVYGKDIFNYINDMI